MDGMLFPHSIQKLFGLLIIVEIDEWDINLICIQFKRDMDFWKLKKKMIGYIVVVA